MRKTHTPFLLAILDGIGNNPNPKGNAVFHAKTPILDHLRQSTPSTELITFGPRVGLPEGQMGNSEVGHLNIGAGRVVEQELLKINRAIERNALGELEALNDAFQYLRQSESSVLHIIGLASSGGVHSSIEHIQALVTASHKAGVKRISVHAITDGRDTPPQAACEEIARLKEFLSGFSQPLPHLVSIIGRYYAMDRDRRWERTQRAYDLYTLGKGEHTRDPVSILKEKKDSGKYDEFLEPIIIQTPHGDCSLVREGDAVLFANFRSDRMRQIVRSFIEPSSSFKGFSRERVINLSKILTLTEYEKDLPVTVLFKPTPTTNHLGEVLSRDGFKQLRIAETEKYPHVTYFFNGGTETPYPGEERILIPSPREVKTYDQKPEMSAFEVTRELISSIENNRRDVYIVNYANGDMVGHTGNLDAAIKAVETVDSCLGQVLEALRKQNGVALVTADHGNAEQMIDYETGEPHTAHTLFPVPLFLVGFKEKNISLRAGASLCDIAPTICEVLEIQPPQEMTGKSLIEK